MKITKTAVITKRFMWWAPWGVTRWWLPRVFRGADEWCNPSVCYNVPPLGCFIFFPLSGKLRVFPCAEDWHIMNPEEQADYAPCGWLRDGVVRQDAHFHASMETLCPEARHWLMWKADDERKRAGDHSTRPSNHRG